MINNDKIQLRHYFIVCISAVSLIILGACWELFLAPLKPGGSWLVLKITPLMLALPGLLKARPYTYKVCSMVCVVYMMISITRLMTESNLSQALALIELLLSLTLFTSLILYLRHPKVS